MDLELADLVGSEIRQICLGRADVQFRFDTGRSICAQAVVEVFRGDALVSAWDPATNWSSTQFQLLLGARVGAYAVRAMRGCWRFVSTMV
ncbi:hypothetical protein LP419_33035 [Massilia sp. H-1]|nr:hypothetical protein LP419_33035 [Massilia sp. H-1]